MACSSLMLSSIQYISLDDEPHFVSPLLEKHMCVYCSRGLRPPVKQTACGHRLCDACLGNILLADSIPMCPAGEEDCVALTENNLYTDRGMDRELMNMEVYCQNAPDCTVTPRWRVLRMHLENCKFNNMSCPNAVYGCEATFQEIRKEHHIEKECRYHPKSCRYCGRDYPGLEVRGHEDQCKRGESACNFSNEGCSFYGSRLDVFDHIHSPEAIAVHLDMTLTKLRAEQKQYQQFRNELQLMEKEHDELKENTNEIQQQIQSVENQWKEESKELQSILDQNKQQAGEFAESAKRISATADAISKIQDRITYLEAKTKANEEFGRKSRVSEDEANIVRSNERLVLMHDATLAENEIRFNCLETTSYNGVLIWKITNYHSHKQAAVEGRTISIYSQPFYTDPYGYKMCARLYLNGDGMGKSTHASLYFVVMKGEYDALLKWPFRQRVTLMLMDQQNGRQHIQDTFKPDPTSTSFRRPVNTMNIASGSPLFVAQSILQSPTYLADDTIYIMVKVEQSGLNHIGFAL